DGAGRELLRLAVPGPHSPQLVGAAGLKSPCVGSGPTGGKHSAVRVADGSANRHSYTDPSWARSFVLRRGSFLACWSVTFPSLPPCSPRWRSPLAAWHWAAS